jgi:RecA-family ATPase
MTIFSAQELLSQHGIAYIATQKSSYTTKCPSCGQGYCTVKIDNKGVRWYCHDCEQGGGEFYEQREQQAGNGHDKKRDEPTKVYDYTGEDGKRLYQSLRFEPTGKPKYFRQRISPDQKKWSIKGARLVPYHLPRLRDAVDNDQVVFVVEGEKDVETLERYGFAATCCAMGAGKWKSEYNAHFEGADVVICGDNDEPGRRHVHQVAQALITVAKCVRILDLTKIWPEIEESDDISDWFARKSFTDHKSEDVLANLIGALDPISERDLRVKEDDDIAPWEPFGEADSPRPPLVWVNLIAALRSREWFIPDLIPMFNVTLLSGEGAIGKSIALLQLSVACVLGADWFGTLPQVGPVIYIAAEEDEDEIRRRLEAIATHPAYRSSREALRENLRVLCFAGTNALLAAPNRHELIEATPLFEQIKAEAVALKPKLIIIDPVADVFGGKEIDRAQTRMFCTLMRGLAIEAQSAVILSSHPSNAGIQTDTGLSGSTAWHNSVRARMYFKNVPDTTPGTRVLEIKKNNYGPVSARIIVRWDNGVYIKPRQASVHDQRSAEQKADTLFVSLILRFEHRNRTVSDSKYAPNFAPTAFVELPEVKAAGINKKALIESMERLIEAERIRIVTEGPPSKRRSRLVVSDLASNHLPTLSQPTFDDMGWNGNFEDGNPRNSGFQPPNSDLEKANDFNVPSSPPITPIPSGGERERTGAVAPGQGTGRPPPPSPGGYRDEGWKPKGRKPAFRLIDDAPADAVCQHCHKPGDVKRIADARYPGSKSETLHIDCAKKYFEAING